MKKKRDIILFLTILLFIFIMFFSIQRNFQHIMILASSLLLIITTITITIFGYRKDILSPLDKNGTYFLIVYFLIYYIIIYGIGFVTGYESNISIIKKVTINIFYLISIGLIEVTRYIIIDKNRKSKIATIIVIILGAIINEILIGQIFRLNIAITIINAISNILIVFILKNFGYKVAIIYRLLLEGFFLIIPVIPKIGSIAFSLFLIILILAIYIKLKNLYNHYEKITIKNRFIKKVCRVIYIPFCMLFILTVVLISKEATFYLMGIASNSMYPEIKRGDALLVKKVSSEEELSIDDIIVFKYKDKYIAHRIVRIKENSGRKNYLTKGDNNLVVDNVNLEIEKIEGKVYFKVPCIAYPAVKGREIIGERKEG